RARGESGGRSLELGRLPPDLTSPWGGALVRFRHHRSEAKVREAGGAPHPSGFTPARGERRAASRGRCPVQLLRTRTAWSELPLRRRPRSSSGLGLRDSRWRRSCRGTAGGSRSSIPPRISAAT